MGKIQRFMSMTSQNIRGAFWQKLGRAIPSPQPNYSYNMLTLHLSSSFTAPIHPSVYHESEILVKTCNCARTRKRYVIHLTVKAKVSNRANGEDAIE